MAGACVQSWGKTETTAATTLQSAAPASSTTAGNLIVVCIGSRALLAGTPVTDSAGNTYTLADHDATADRAAIWFCVNATSIASSTGWVKVTAGGSTTLAFHVLEVSGCLTASPLDAHTNGRNSNTAPTATTGTTTQADEFAVAMIGYLANAATISGFTAGWDTSIAQDYSNVAAAGVKVNVGTQVLSSTAAMTFAATLSGSSGWGDVVVTFKAATSTAYTRSVAETALVTESSARIFGGLRLPSESAAVIDATARLIAAQRAAVEAMTVTDATARAAIAQRATADTTPTTDVSERQGASQRSPVDSALVGDALGVIRGFARSMTDAALTSEVAARVSASVRSMVDTVPTTDAPPSRLAAAVRGIADALAAVSDSVSAAYNAGSHAFTRAIADSAATADTAARQAAVQRQAQEATPTADSTSRLGRWARAVADIATVTDAIRKDVTRNLVESLATSDVASRIAAFQRSLADLLPTLIDTVTGLFTSSRNAKLDVTVKDAYTAVVNVVPASKADVKIIDTYQAGITVQQAATIGVRVLPAYTVDISIQRIQMSTTGNTSRIIATFQALQSDLVTYAPFDPAGNVTYVYRDPTSGAKTTVVAPNAAIIHSGTGVYYMDVFAPDGHDGDWACRVYVPNLVSGEGEFASAVSILS